MKFNKSYKVVFSSDWSECLSPNGPFDPLSYTHRLMNAELSTIFRKYTGNEISLSVATERIRELLPEPFTKEQMDAYLDSSFHTYTNVPDLIEWCLSNDILFMINTTGTQGYFQRVLHKKLLPPVPVVAANPLITFETPGWDTVFKYQVLEIEDKAKNTQAVITELNIPVNHVLVMGDSGGDGPHFRWGNSAGAYLIGSMTKHSLQAYCDSTGVTIRTHFGLTYGPGEKPDADREMNVDFMELTDVIREVVDFLPT